MEKTKIAAHTDRGLWIWPLMGGRESVYKCSDRLCSLVSTLLPNGGKRGTKTGSKRKRNAKYSHRWSEILFRSYQILVLLDWCCVFFSLRYGKKAYNRHPTMTGILWDKNSGSGGNKTERLGGIYWEWKRGIARGSRDGMRCEWASCFQKQDGLTISFPRGCM